MANSPSRPQFDPVDTSFDPNEVSARDDAVVVESPSLSNSNALARFEFEPGRSKDGTKVLMVEWEDDATTRGVGGDWEISWDGKRTVLPARDHAATATASNQTTSGEEDPVNRLYFLLGAGVNVPATVHLRKGSVVWKTSPLPAIFSPELGATARQAGKKGVLHTIWAKKRLQVLQSEIGAETRENAEGIGLEMAMAEKEWIEQNFGILARPSNIAMPSSDFASAIGPAADAPTSPRSPGGSRLMDKLNSLRVGTTAQDPATGRPSADATNTDEIHGLLSPETADVAVGGYGSFAALKGPMPSSNAELAPQQSTQTTGRIVAQRPPESFAAQQRQQLGMGSLDAAFVSTAPAEGLGLSTSLENVDGANDDLFALPMSPRNADTNKSPFSFSAQDTKAYAPGDNITKES